MSKKSDRDKDPPSPSAVTDTFKQLTAAIEVQRQNLSHVQVSIRTLAELMTEACNFGLYEPDLGYCCKAASDILVRVVASLQEHTEATALEITTMEPGRLEATLEDQRQQLFRAHAVVRATAALCRVHHQKSGEADLSYVLAAADKTIDDVITDLEPLSLGLKGR